jgi:8-oxo-dGTP pyrophosphatase MutT (NUDIX family)
MAGTLAALLDPATLRACLLAEPPQLPLQPKCGKDDLFPGAGPLLIPSAVVVPIVARPEPALLFTKRSENLSRHGGQVSFPGGQAQDCDASLAVTALREMQEETGIAAAFVTLAGYLNAFETITGYAVLPVVGLLHTGFTLTPNAAEVEDIFEVPLAFLLDPANRKLEQGRGGKRQFYFFHYKSHYIWGATAAIVVELAERLHDAT